MPEVAGGWEEHEFFKAYNYDLASAIRADGSAADHTRDSWSYHPKHWRLALPLPDHVVLRDNRNKQECCWRNNKEATSTSWPPNIQQTGEHKK
ncbi:hypothetical protein ACOSQ4_013961 [Xanthoceras sorbifolium]